MYNVSEFISLGHMAVGGALICPPRPLTFNRADAESIGRAGRTHHISRFLDPIRAYSGILHGTDFKVDSR